MKTRPQIQKRTAGFSLVEIVTTVAIIGVLTGVGIVAVKGTRSSAQNIKLDKDVAALNSAIQVYQASGGSLTGVTNADEIIAKLKTVAKNDASKKQIVGLKEEMVDVRIEPVVQTTGEAKTSAPRAVWNGTTKRFEVKTTGSGIREFRMNDALASVASKEEVRTTDLKFAKVNKWVWDFKDGKPEFANGVKNVAGSLPPLPTITPPTGAKKLKAPSPTASATSALITFPKSVGIFDNNPADTAMIEFSTTAGKVMPYSGTFMVDPGTMVTAKALARDPELYTDSDPANATYDAVPETLAFDVRFDKPHYNYAELGGALMVGSTGVPPLAKPGTITLANSAKIPAAYQNNSVFQAYWTTNGASPLTAVAGRQQGPAFTNGFSPVPVTLSVSDWGTGTTMAVNAAGVAINTKIVNTSPVISKTLGIEKIKLPAPWTDCKDGANWGEFIITITLNPAGGILPVGSRVYYTTDGSKPGDLNGKPTSGTLYTAPFIVKTTSGLDITARTYAPDAAANWFSVSNTNIFGIPAPPPLDVYIGGVFANVSGGGRNIARLAADGSLDPTFNPGTGATAGSVVATLLRSTSNSVVVGGDFWDVNGTTRVALARMTDTGAVDTSFDANIQ